MSVNLKIKYVDKDVKCLTYKKIRKTCMYGTGMPWSLLSIFTPFGKQCIFFHLCPFLFLFFIFIKMFGGPMLQKEEKVEEPEVKKKEAPRTGQYSSMLVYLRLYFLGLTWENQQTQSPTASYFLNCKFFLNTNVQYDLMAKMFA